MIEMVQLVIICWQPFSFPIEVTYEDLKDKCLHQAINCDRHPLLQVYMCLFITNDKCLID